MTDVNLEFTLSHPRVRPGEPCTVWAMIRLIAGNRHSGTGGRGGGEGEGPVRLPLNLALVLDRSGSMAGEKLDYVRRAACFVVDQAGPADRLALVTFDDQVEVPWPAQEVKYKDSLKQVIRFIRPGGSTNLSGGMLTGCAEVNKHLRSGQINRVILLTDGLANVGIVDPASLQNKAREIAGTGISISTMGVGTDFNEDLLIGISEASGGNSYFIENPDSIPRVFAQELQGLLTVLAQSIRVTVQGGGGAEGRGGAEVVGFLGYESIPVPGGVAVGLPDLYEHETKLLLAEIRLPALEAGEHEVCRLGCEYMAVDAGLASVRMDATVRIRVDGEGEWTPDLEVIKHVRIFEGALARDRAVEAADRGDIARSKEILREQVVAYNALIEDLPGDVVLADELENFSGLLAQVERKDSLDLKSRKEMRYTSYMTRRGRGSQAQ